MFLRASENPKKDKKIFPCRRETILQVFKALFSKNTVHPVTGKQTYGVIFADTMRRIFLVKY